LFIDPAPEQIEAAKRCQATVIELHSGRYADAVSNAEREHELKRLHSATAFALTLGLTVNAGHGLNYHNVCPIAAISGINELNIGHAIVAHALFVGFKPAVAQMKALITEAVRWS